jgi:hypothetical protein
MSIRLQRLATDWKTYLAVLAGLGSLLEAITGVFTKLTQLSEGATHAPVETRWVAVALLAIVATLALFSVLSRRSILLRPERFLVSADDSRLLVGRDEELNALAARCETSPLVFLTGESGAGKSALVTAGLLPHYQNADDDRTSAQVLVPILVDASSLSWSGGLRTELSRELRSLSDEERKKLGFEKVDAESVFDVISRLPRDAPYRLLIILDQIDDYILNHQALFVRDRIVVSRECIEAANPDWKAISSIIRDGALLLLAVCRDDVVGMLEPLRFVRPIMVPLPRVDPQLIRPLLERVTADDKKGRVIEDPDYGWNQLKLRLLRDMAVGESEILPVRLAVALNSLRRFKYLTPGAYARSGGLRGLERLHVERHLREAARRSRIENALLLRGLVSLVTKDGCNTQRVTREEFSAGSGKNTDLESGLIYLEDERVLRRQFDGSVEYLLLYHAYLARCVREVFRYANRWTEMLREREEEFRQATDIQQRWKALLPVVTQARFLWARFNRQFIYGQHRYFAFWSLLRLVPVLAFVAALISGYFWEDQRRQDQIAQRVIAGIGTGTRLDAAEASDWSELATTNAHARLRAVQIALSSGSIAARIRDKEDLLLHVAVGLDPSGNLRRRLVKEVIAPMLRQAGPDRSIYLIVKRLCANLQLSDSMAAYLVQSMLERMQSAQPSDALILDGLNEVLATVSEKLDKRSAKASAEALLKLMSSSEATVTSLITEFGKGLAALSDKLETKDVEPGIKILADRMKSLSPSEIGPTSALAGVLASFKDKLSSDVAEACATILVVRMVRTEWSEDESLEQLVQGLAGVKDRLKAEDARRLAKVLADRMTAAQPNEGELLLDLGSALSYLQVRFQEHEESVQAAVALVRRMSSAQSNENLLVAELGGVLSGLIGELKEGDEIAQRGAELLIARMNSEHSNESRVFVQLADVLDGLASKLNGEQVKSGVEAWITRFTGVHLVQ